MLRSFKTVSRFSQLKKEIAELIPKKREGKINNIENWLLSRKPTAIMSSPTSKLSKSLQE